MTELKPEERARTWIDRKLKEAGWLVINRDEYAPGLTAVAVREAPMKGRLESDYLLFLNGKAVAVVEAKREEISLDNPKLIKQAENYTHKVHDWCPVYERPLPFIFLSNGKEIAFKNSREENAEYELVKKFLRPWDIAKKLKLNEFDGLPYLSTDDDLRACQYDAICNLEASFKQGQKRALIVLATGAGKTFTACMIIYRLLAYTPMQRVLFLVDRTNLGNDAAAALMNFNLTEDKKKMSELYTIEQMSRSEVKSRIVVSTIQRLYSKLSGDSDAYNEQEESESFNRSVGKVVDLPDNPSLPPDYFDLIIIDECHRSIYSEWQKVINYFKTARLVGLTATPIPETIAFFNDNKVAEYSYEDSVLDDVNVGYRIYRIKTQLTEEGGQIDTGDEMKVTNRLRGETKEQTAISDRKFESSKLNRSIIVRDQIRKVLEQYKNAVYTQMYPEREPNFDYLPKTLIFAASDAHARMIVEVANEVFERSDDKFAQRITYSSENSQDLIKSFRNDVEFRIAVTVTLVATGTDVRPLEVLIFMNDVHSETLYAQMKGRGCRTIHHSLLQSVTPNAISKDLFFLIDAVGVTESDKAMPRAGKEDYVPNPTLEELFEKMSFGYLPDDYFILLANKLSTIGNRSDAEELQEYAQICSISPVDWARRIFDAMEEDKLPPFTDSSEDNTERKNVIPDLLNNIPVRRKLVEMAKGYVKELVHHTDEVTYAGFSTEEAKSYTESFKDYVNTHRDEIQALRLIYNDEVGKLTRDSIDELNRKLERSLQGFTISRLWNDFALVDGDKVKPIKSDDKAITNLIQLVRYAYEKISELYTLTGRAKQRFTLWCGQNQRNISDEQIALFKKVAEYIANNGACSMRDVAQNMPEVAGPLIGFANDPEEVANELVSLNEFILKVA